MTQKTKFEKKDNASTKATFERDEVMAFAMMGSYAQMRREAYLAKIASRDPNPRLIDGAENLNPYSMVAEVDMAPLSMRQNLGRFMGDRVIDDGYDTDTDDNSDESFHSGDRMDNIPTPHELRASRLERKLENARRAHQASLDAARDAGATPASKNKNEPSETAQGSKEPTNKPSE